MNTLTHITALLVAAVAFSSSSVVQSPSNREGTFELLILHNNDMHARFEQTSQLSGTCSPKDRDAGKCYGGFPRVAYVVKEARKAAAAGTGPPVLYLNAGDTYTGTAWFTVYKWKIAAEFINALQPDAVSLGNHELDNGVEGLTPFIRNLTSPVLAANLILDKVPELQNEPNLQNSVILLINQTKIGIIGYLTPDTKILAAKNNVEYEDEIIAIKREVEVLKRHGVKIFIALGHSGYEKDIEIANKVNDIDLVVGGHSHTYLGEPNGEKPETSVGPYPTVVMQPSGRKVPVVQAYAMTKYIGKLHLTFDFNGEITKHDGLPLLLDHNIPEDPELVISITQYKDQIDKLNSDVLGQSIVPLSGNCRFVECIMGNIITDAILEYTARHNPKYSDVNIAIIQGGAIRVTADHSKSPTNITRGELLTVLPYANPLVMVAMNGTILKQALEHSVDKWTRVNSGGQFLQVAGIKVIYDLSEPVGSRVVQSKAICSHCGNLTEINENYEYKVFMPQFVANGGDGYSMFESLPREQVSYDELICTIDYIRTNSPVKPEILDRIILRNEEYMTEKSINSSKTVFISGSFQIISLLLFPIFAIVMG